MKRSLNSSFSAATNFDACLRVNAGTEAKLSLFPLSEITGLTALAGRFSYIELRGRSGGIVVAMGLDELHQHLRRVDLTTGVIDLTGVTGQNALIAGEAAFPNVKTDLAQIPDETAPAATQPTISESKLKADFKAASDKKTGDYIMLRVYAANLNYPNDIRDTLIRLSPSMEIKSRSGYPDVRCYIDMSSSERRGDHLEVRISPERLMAFVTDAKRRQNLYLDMRAECRIPTTDHTSKALEKRL